MDNNEEKAWEYWKGIVCHPDGSLNEEQVKKELADYYFILDQVPQVYTHITNNTLSKPNYYAGVVTSLADECYRKDYIEQLKEFLSAMEEDEVINKTQLQQMLDVIEQHI